MPTAKQKVIRARRHRKEKRLKAQARELREQLKSKHYHREKKNVFGKVIG